MTPVELVADTRGLITLPEIYLKIRELIEQPYSSIDDFADVVMLDPNLSARVLNISNSAFFGFAAEIDTVSRAINLMGISQLHDLVLATSAIAAFRNLPTQLVDMQDFWLESIHCGVVSRMLATHCNVLDSERLFVAGLLHQIGHLVMYIKMPEESAECLRREVVEMTPLHLIEREVAGFDYAQVGGELLKSWDLPEGFHVTVSHHIEPRRAEIFALETSIVHLARQMVHHHALRQKGIQRTMQIDPVVWQETGQSQTIIQPVMQESLKYLDEAMRLLFPMENRRRA